MRIVSALAACVIGLAATSVPAKAACYGTGAFSSCSDAYGNSYTVNRMGPMTTMNGYNSNTGSNWSETTQTMGNMTTYNGMTNGNPWSMTQQNFGGGMRSYSGTNSAGQPFSHTCTAFGCN